MSAVADVRPALIGHLKDLHLPTVRECYEDTARRAERETLSYEQYLLEVISRECEQRRKKQGAAVAERLGAAAGEVAAEFRSEAACRPKRQRQLRTLLDGASWTGKKTFWCSGILDRERAIC